MRKYSFEKLAAYKYARALSRKLSSEVLAFPDYERFALCDQVRRAASSVALNIAEGMSRTSTKEQIRFLEMSHGSLMELIACMDIAFDNLYISNDKRIELRTHIDETEKRVVGLRKYLQKKLNSRPPKPINP